MKLKLTARPDRPKELPCEVEPGQWYWVEHEDRPEWDDDEEDFKPPAKITELACVTRLGSNFAKFQFVRDWDTTIRIHEDEFDDCCTFEPNHEAYLQSQVEKHQQRVDSLLNEVKALTARLGITRAAIGPSEVPDTSTALAVVHGTENIKAHKAALIKAKDKTLPELFKKVEEEHREMARWMKASLIPLKAQAAGLKHTTAAIEDRIFTVELYAGLCEEVTKIRDGAPAPNDTPIHLFQRRHYMDEECLIRYEAGGMSFKNIEAFDEWLIRDTNLDRLLPHTRCVVAFRVRRFDIERDTTGASLGDFIRFWHEDEQNKRTFLYMRNGAQVFRLETGIQFDHDLFPDTDQSVLLSNDDPLWAQVNCGEVKWIVTERRIEEMRETRKRQEEEYAATEAEWEKHSEEYQEENWHKRPEEPWRWYNNNPAEYERVDKESCYYDDVMRKIAEDARAHNRVAVVVQGLLDRSPVFHPHPPWQIWTQEGFERALVLVYDTSHALTSGDPPDFEAYRATLNASLKRGSFTVGQEFEWAKAMAKKENERYRAWNDRRSGDYKTFHPYGNLGPGEVAKVDRFGPKRGCTYEWYRKRRRYHAWKDDKIKTSFSCPTDKLLNVSAYKPGDFHIFFDDPRTRVDYVKWAPILLRAEDWYAKGKNKQRKGKS